MLEPALADLTVVECGLGLAGAFCAKALADLGADVIKVEPPDGDPARRAGPFFGDTPNNEASGQFLYLNANKRGITLDLEADRGRRNLRELLQPADILVTDFSPRRLEELELDYPHLQTLNPGLIATCISPFGQTGPYRDYLGSDLIAWHMGGTGYGTPYNAVSNPEEQPPLRGGGYQAEYLAGWTAAAATMAALFHRHTYGSGQMVDISAMEAVANMMRPSFAAYSYQREAIVDTRRKNGLAWVFPCKDGHISTSFARDHWWDSMKEVMGRPEWAESPVFADLASRRVNADALELLLIEWFMRHTRQELYRMLQASGVSCFPINSIQEVVDSPQYAAREFFVEQEHPVAGRIKQPGPPVRYSKTPWRLRKAAPLLGEHNQEVLGGLMGYSRENLRQPESAGRFSPRTATKEDQPLKGLRVLDFGWILSVPHCTAWLGTLGAEVIRVESEAHPDLFRMTRLGGVADGIPGVNRLANFNGLNFSKKGITLDLATARGLDLARELVNVSDVVTHNFATGVIDRLGLGYEALRAIKPDIIMLTGSTLGVTGPEKQATGLGPNVTGYAGLPFISGYADGDPADLGGAWPDFMIGTMMVFSLLSAVHHRQRTGQGQHVEVAMGEVVTTMIPEAILEYTMNGRQRPRRGNRDEFMAPHGVYPCRGEDKWVAVAVSSDGEWAAMCRAMSCPEWAGDPRFTDTPGRHRHHSELDELIAKWTRQHTPYEVMHALQDVGVAAGPVMGVTDLMADPHLIERGFVVEVDHPEVGRRTVAGLPTKFSAMPRLGYFSAPCLGQHNQEVFQELLGLGDREYQRLAEE